MENNWISVEEKLPEIGEDVILFIPHHRYCKQRVDKITDFEDFEYGISCLCTEDDFILSSRTDFFDRSECATHWQPLLKEPVIK